MSLMGTRVQRVEDRRLLTRGGRYLDDLDGDGVLHAVFVRSTMAHAAIRAIDRSTAEGHEGVVAVATLSDLDRPLVADPDIAALFSVPIVRPWLADGVVRFVGEPIAAVVARTRAQALDAAAAVIIDYEPRAVVVDVEAALEPDAPRLFPEAGTNVVASIGAPSDDDGFFAGCDVVVRQRIVNHRVAACPLETRGAMSEWRDGRLHHWTSTQRPHGVRDTLATYLGCEPSQIRLRTADVGGGFGVKIGVAREELVVAQLARRLGRPIKWYEDRTDAMQAMGHGRGQVQYAELGGGRDGQLRAYRLRVVQEAGAYPDVGAILPVYTALMAPGVYPFAATAFSSQSVVTNTAPTVAFRGAGRPEATAALERIVDVFAAEVGIDPAEVRRRNAIPSGAFPFDTTTGARYDSGDYIGVLDKVLTAIDYAGLRREQARRRASGERQLLGIGLSLYVEITNAPGGADASSITITEAGDAIVVTGSAPTGQGHETVWATLVSDRLGVPIERVQVVYGDTDLVAAGRGTMGSSSLQVAGVAVDRAAVALFEQARLLAADALEANPLDVVAVAGGLGVTGTPTRSVDWPTLARHALQRGDPLRASASFEAPAPTFPFGAHAAVVEVDTDTGAVVLLRLAGADDAGTVVNPSIFEGQLHGGFAQGAAQALYEGVLYDESGNLLTSSFADYAIVSAPELPPFEVIQSQTPTPYNELGVKGVGESGTIGATPAVQNAVVDALAHIGIRHIDMPATPERVWRAIEFRRFDDVD